MHHSTVGSFDETFVDLLAVFIEAHVTYVVCAIAFGLVSHGDHFAGIGIEFRMCGERPTL